MPWNNVHPTLSRKKAVHKIMWGLIPLLYRDGTEKCLEGNTSKVGGELTGEFLQGAFIPSVTRMTIKGTNNDWLTIKNLSAVWNPGKGPRRQGLEFQGQLTDI